MRALLFPLLLLAAGAARAQPLAEFDTRRLRGSEGIVVRLARPQGWRKVAVDDPQVLAELRGPLGPLTGILQIGRGQRRADLQEACRPERARTMLQNVVANEPDTRVTEVFARRHQDRPGFELAYERQGGTDFLRVRSVIVCLKDTRVVVSCGAAATLKGRLGEIEPVCRQVLESLSIEEDTP